MKWIESGAIAPGSDRTQGGILHRIERMGGQRGLRMAEQRQQVLGRSGAQAEKLDKSTVGDTAARFYSESGIPVRNIAYGFDPGLPHGGIGGFDGLCSLFGGEAFPHLRHGTSKPRKTAPFGDRSQQIGEFEVTVGIDQPRSEHPGIKLGAGTPVGARDTSRRRGCGRRPQPRPPGDCGAGPAVSKAG